jgi:hypothetical protein
VVMLAAKTLESSHFFLFYFFFFVTTFFPQIMTHSDNDDYRNKNVMNNKSPFDATETTGETTYTTVFL